LGFLHDPASHRRSWNRSSGHPIILAGIASRNWVLRQSNIVTVSKKESIHQPPFEPSQAAAGQRLAAKSFPHPPENSTPFELGVMSEKDCDSKQKAHRRKRQWACFER
jgi:hypothetical protein